MTEIAVVGAGPAGLFAAEHLARAGFSVTIFEQMPTPARKFLMAGRGGLNLTHSEPLERFLARYGNDAAHVRGAIEAFPPSALIQWADALGAETLVGSSGRVFPKEMKASPLLRAWLRRLADLGVVVKARHRWTGFDGADGLVFEGPNDTREIVRPAATLLALGGASWPKLGSTGAWISVLQDAGIETTPLEASNAGAIIAWSNILKSKHAGAPLKRIAVRIGARSVRGEAVITRGGLEGGAIYALSRELRTALEHGPATLEIDLRPDMESAELTDRLARIKTKDSMANGLRKAVGLSAAAIALLRECHPALAREPAELALQIKSARLRVDRLAGLERAISTAGGIAPGALDEHFMLRSRAGVFAAGEMLDWDAPTGGYLLQASFATGLAAARGIENSLRRAKAFGETAAS